ncbi:hypothetical protein MJO29_002519, partial [Puccinia striiformis f. sp. tritici]
ESNKDPLLPLSDPEAIFWAANAERRRRIAAHAVETAINVPLPSTPTLQATTLPSRAVTPVPSVPTTSASFNELPSPFLQRHTMSNPTDSSQPSKDDMSMTDCLEAMMAIQQTTAHLTLAFRMSPSTTPTPDQKIMIFADKRCSH